MQMYDTTTRIVSQSNVRRGSFAAYYPIEGPDILEFLEIRENGNAIQDMSIGVTITDEWMKAMKDGDKDKRKLWARVIKKRFETGYPYIFWTDTVNKNAPLWYRDKGMKIHASNLCSEICLPSDVENSFVCDLSSMNLLNFEKWKDTDAVEILTYFLDAIMEEYIEKTKDLPFMKKAHNFAKNHRALGLGGLGWHSYLQSKMIAFESTEAKIKNTQIWKLIEEKTILASKKMAELYGEPAVLKGYGMRNSTLVAVAPTTSSSFILGQVSPSIEPLNSNYFVKDLAKGKFTYKSPFLKEVLAKYDKDDSATWKTIMVHGGSVQHLDFLTENEKMVFKTFGEISQKEIVIQAAARQKYIDQSQSLNLMIHPDTSLKDVNELMIFAWESGIKTLYYQRGTNPSQELARNLLNCVSCEA
jgi:ribonucleoside-diphosphate reductase alpha chain